MTDRLGFEKIFVVKNLQMLQKMKDSAKVKFNGPLLFWTVLRAKVGH
jgi:hypothetical protein